MTQSKKSFISASGFCFDFRGIDQISFASASGLEVAQEPSESVKHHWPERGRPVNTNKDQKKLIGKSTSWNALFKSLAAAEAAAANECLKIATQFRDSGHSKLQKTYERLANEEIEHSKLAMSIVRGPASITDQAKKVYEGCYFSSNASILERLVSVHLVFEPSALAFLGFISTHSKELIDDPQWASEITKAFNRVLKDEVNHVFSGAKLIKDVWSEAAEIERRQSMKTLRKHRAFLKVGLASFFKPYEGDREFVSKMLNRFDFYFNRATKGVLNECHA